VAYIEVVAHPSLELHQPALAAGRHPPVERRVREEHHAVTPQRVVAPLACEGMIRMMMMMMVRMMVPGLRMMDR
jgi:hypothetical protein